METACHEKTNKLGKTNGNFSPLSLLTRTEGRTEAREATAAEDMSSFRKRKRGGREKKKGKERKLKKIVAERRKSSSSSRAAHLASTFFFCFDKTVVSLDRNLFFFLSKSKNKAERRKKRKRDTQKKWPRTPSSRPLAKQPSSWCDPALQ